MPTYGDGNFYGRIELLKAFLRDKAEKEKAAILEKSKTQELTAVEKMMLNPLTVEQARKQVEDLNSSLGLPVPAWEDHDYLNRKGHALSYRFTYKFPVEEKIFNTSEIDVEGDYESYEDAVMQLDKVANEEVERIEREGFVILEVVKTYKKPH